MARPLLVLKGTRILSLALNLPGPAALMRCRRMGARCVKVEPPGGDPMGRYEQQAYAQLHEGVKVLAADLKTGEGQKILHQELAKADVLLTSFRPSALDKLGIGWNKLHRRYPGLSHVAIVGAPAPRAEEPGHDLTYLAAHGLVPALDLPATLYADMGGSLMAAEAVLQATLRARRHDASSARPAGVFIEVALSQAADYLALPRRWGLTGARGFLGGAHAGYRVYPCKDGRVAVAALEPRFAASLCAAAGVMAQGSGVMLARRTHDAIAAFLKTRTRAQLERLARAHDIPLHTMA
jgi:crotonobetainyl-CoA:carnitine CoA-transferase CaiB-like acyl-CoA transferase